MSAARANRAGATGRRGMASHQNKMDKILREHDYEFLRVDSNLHNIYVNKHGQRVTVPCSPKNSGNSTRLMMQDMARHARERNGMATTAKVNPADQMLAMADTYLMTQPPANDKRAIDAHYSAFVAWMKRAVEKYGPVPGASLTEAAERMGYKEGPTVRARKAAGVLSYNPGGRPTVWMACLDHQLPEGMKRRLAPGQKDRQVAVDPIAPDKPEPQQVRVVDMAMISPEATNGKKPVTDQQQAFLLMAESLGMEIPDTEHAVQVLDAVILSIESNLEALKAAREKLS